MDAVVLATGYCYSFPFLDEGPVGMRFEGLRHVTPQQPQVESAVLVVPQAATPTSRGWLSPSSWLHHTSGRASEPRRAHLEAAVRP